jgi:hypothetical protein
MNGIKRVNRRHGPDTMVKVISIFSGISWLLVVIVFGIITYGKPRLGMMFFHEGVTESWNKTILGYASLLLFFVFIVCFIGIFINMSRHKRKSDRFNKSLIVFGIASLLGILYYFAFV